MRANIARRTAAPAARVAAPAVRGAQVVAFAGKGRPSKDDAKGDGVTGKDTSKPKDWDTERKKAAKFADSDDGLADQKRYDW
jgi:hypothetical protein